MIRWFVDKESKMPLYVQLKDEIQYYISTGALSSEEQLPPVKSMAKELGSNFETVRKAYKELEREGLITMKRSEGTYLCAGQTPSVRARYRATGTCRTLLAKAH